MRLILGSQSQSRRAVLQAAGYQFETINPQVDEDAIQHANLQTLALLRARAKEQSIIAKTIGDAVIIVSDQTLLWNGQLREKPLSCQQAQEFLAGYARYPAETYTAVITHNTVTHQRAEAIDIARIYFRPLPESLIRKIASEPACLTRNGGFAVEDPRLAPYILRIEGTSDSIMGLPLALTQKLIQQVFAGILPMR